MPDLTDKVIKILERGRNCCELLEKGEHGQPDLYRNVKNNHTALVPQKITARRTAYYIFECLNIRDYDL
jgi:hypothetical protein